MHNTEYDLFTDFLMALGIIIAAQLIWIWCTGHTSIHFVTTFTIISLLWLCRQALYLLDGR